VINADRASSMHNPGSMGQDEAQPWIHGDLVGIPSSYRLRDGLQLRFPAGRLEFDRVINADRASSMHNPGSMGQHDAQPWIHGDLVGIPSSYRLRDGLQLRFPAGRLEFDRVINAGPGLDAVPLMDPWGPICSSLELSAPTGPAAAIPTGGDSMHNLGFQGRKYAQPWIPGPEVCRRLQTFGERLQTKASSCDPLRAGWNPIE
jgi:hypothetical protein